MDRSINRSRRPKHSKPGRRNRRRGRRDPPGETRQTGEIQSEEREEKRGQQTTKREQRGRKGSGAVYSAASSTRQCSFLQTNTYIYTHTLSFSVINPSIGIDSFTHTRTQRPVSHTKNALIGVRERESRLQPKALASGSRFFSFLLSGTPPYGIAPPCQGRGLRRIFARPGRTLEGGSCPLQPFQSTKTSFDPLHQRKRCGVAVHAL